MNTTPERLERIDSRRMADPTAPRRLTAAELEDHMREQRDWHEQSVEDALRLFRARPHRRASDNDSRLGPQDRARAAAARASHQHAPRARRDATAELGWWCTVLVLLGIFASVAAFHCGRYGCGW